VRGGLDLNVEDPIDLRRAPFVIICTGAPGSTIASPASATQVPKAALACSISAGSSGIPDP
jgi:hypothetical protein